MTVVFMTRRSTQLLKAFVIPEDVTGIGNASLEPHWSYAFADGDMMLQAIGYEHWDV